MDEQSGELTRHQKRQMERTEKDRTRSKHERKGRGGKVVGTILVLAILGLIIWGVSSKSTNAPQGNPNDIRTEDHIKGPSEASVTVIEYSDFQCPACGAYFPLIKQVEDAFPKELRVVYRHFPLTQVHPNAFGAAMVAEAASKQNKFWEMHDILFSRQGDWSSLSNPADKFVEYAKELGMNEEQFKADAVSADTKGRVQADQTLANRLSVQSTPTFYVNGTKLNTNPNSLDAFKAIIQSAATLAATQKPVEPQYHTHADLRVVLSNQAVNLSQAKYQSSKAAKVLNENIHLHDGKGNILHIHKADATLGEFFKSLGMELENTCFTLDTRVKYCSNGTQTLRLYVNGKEQINPPAYVPQDLDRILIVYGVESDEQIAALNKTVTDESCIYSLKCPERGKPPTEECVGGLETGCE